MALLFADGFDHYLAADIFKKWTTFVQVAGGNIGPAYARPPGGSGFQSQSAASSGWGIFRYLGSANPSTVIFGANVYITAFGQVGLAVSDNSQTYAGQVGWYLDGSGHLLVHSAGTVLFTSSNVFALNTWYHIEVKATIHLSAGIIEARVNGSSTGWVPQQTGLNTRRQSANAYVNWLSLTGNNWYWDDVYVLDTSGSGIDKDFLGPQKIITCYPSGAGSHADFIGSYAANYSNVNETAADGDSTFNQSATAGNIDSFNFDDVPTGTIAAIQHVIEARQDAGGPRVIAAMQRSGTTDYVSSLQPVLAGSHLFYLDPKSQNPDTSANWSASAFNASEFGYKLVS